MAGAIPRPASTIMANPTTTHVIEIETGIGEPAFIPLSMGHELQPISVGKKGMWRIESPRVLDVHAFVYFDGTSLFLQSADEQNAASVDGYRVGKAWTELHAPCNIEVGAARLRYRSLIADDDNERTMMAQSPPVAMPPGGPGGMRPGAGASIPVAGAPPPPAPGNAARLPTGGQPQQGPQPQTRPPIAQGSAPGVQPGGSGPVAFPKADRPFKPGEFSAPADLDESTRIAPLDATGGGRVASGSHPRPAAGQPVGDEARMMRGNTGAVPAAAGSAPYGSMQAPGAMQPDMMHPDGYHEARQGGMPPQGPGGMQSGGYPQQGYPAQQQGYGAHGGYSAGGSGAFNAMTGTGPQLPPGMQGQGGPSMPPGGYGSMTPQGGMQHPAPAQTPMQEFVAKLKANSIPKIIAGVLFIIGGILYLAEDDEPQAPPKRRTTATLDGGPMEGGTAAGTAAGGTGTGPALTAPPVMTQAPSPAWPAGVPCPPPNWPPNTPLPCTPNGIGSPPDRPAPPDKPEKGGRDAGTKESKDAGAALPAGAKTLERQAVDYVAAGDTAKAAATYEELVRRDPNNKVYAEAARILRAKLDGGLPGGP